MRVLFVFLAIFVSFAQPIIIEADQLTYEKDKLIYNGNVKVSRADGVLKAQRLVIFLDEKKRAKSAEATGQPLYRDEKRQASADSIQYDFEKEILILKGNARLQEGESFIEAPQITYFRKEDRALAQGRVRTIYVEESRDKVPADRKP
ncbi:MAG: lipopolysaccharide transport periplasmic protein LptA [Aquificaceae bacterium]|nr:lipopolysaccharide transport periplasmic protein LptA [Aquificaceae bacterium]MDW8237019.1 lipopolysaccharide transport periplasmic protein LptA [Aquificaceae bacterium]